MSTKIDPRGKVFRDPIHHLISIEREDGFLLELMDTMEFQRLRRIRQLGVSCLTYPGAEHTRFNHSLGVFNFTQRMVRALERRYGPCGELAPLTAKKQALKAAALLHDIGHGPFSHMVERAFKTKNNHEARTTALIGTPGTEVHEALKRNAIDPLDVKAIIDHASGVPYLQDIVSSQLDADRMDYILRDAHFTGVRYGAYDAEWILNSLCLGLDPAAGAGDTGVRQLRLCLDARRGLHSAEQLIIARYHMSMQVYFHRTTRCWESHLLMLFNEARRLAGDLPSTTPSVVRSFVEKGGEVTNEEFLRLDDAVMIAAIAEWAWSQKAAHRFLAQLAEAFLRRRKLLKMRQLTKDEARADQRMLLRARLQTLAGAEGEKWLLDDGNVGLYKFLPAPSGAGGTAHSAILLASGEFNERATPFESSSMLISPFAPKPDSYTGDSGKSAIYRVYYLPELEDRVTKAFDESSGLLFK